MYVDNEAAEGDEKTKHETGNDRSEKRSGKPSWRRYLRLRVGPQSEQINNLCRF
jgi:hypothetical protein